jgi:hypothetical protein
MGKKAKLFSLLLMILMVSGVQQINAQIKSGIRLGLNYPNLTELTPQDNNGFHMGSYIRFSLAGIVALEPGFQYSQRKFPVKSNLSSSTSTVKLKYLDIPVIFRLSLLPFVNVFGGPQASVLVGKKLKGEGDIENLHGLTSHQIGGVAGIGIKLPLGINIQGSYDFGLPDLSFQGQTINNRIIKVSLGKDF